MNQKSDFIKNFEKVQEKIRTEMVLRDEFGCIEKIGGVDQAFVNDELIISSLLLFNEEIELIEKSFAFNEISFPYLPGYLTLREAPVIYKDYRKLEKDIDLLFFDGSGLIHPRFVGLATHVGVELNIPTIGVTKNLLCGEVVNEVKEVGENSKVIYKDRKVGYALKSKEGCNPIYVSPGHKVSLESSLELTKKFIFNHKLPLPILEAHLEVNRIKKEIESKK